ncbi:succinyl-diaminopimelate desuccinylase [Caenispirillum bisanense]|uniref:Succinyl-diaminopimelate desuccinylase n=1 Tax=Caenispirillum bisanense TaxID=414052 RepID=A0A286GAP9_9PROT|nr:succinyl-diaminopimelate desuccinylase [Caenispirillum bisanense]SOD92084.1 succinyldiaminopimelate desuccinylase [Caenispirillum bisanense]
MTVDTADLALTPATLADPLPLARALIRRASVTPRDAGALDVLQAALESLGFRCTRLPFGEGEARVDNLYARLGDEGPNFCFAGHTDVVPVGEGWTVDPFGAEVIDGRLFGRGAADMKGAIAAFVAAVARLLAERDPRGSISLLITGDEEGDAVNGTVKVLEWLAEQGETLDHCLVGEPTNPARLGDMMKIGRRGSLNARLTVYGAQGHVAYPHLADNPIPRLMRMLGALIERPLDAGTEHFQPSNLEIVTIDVGNTASNVIPGAAHARFNIRFNDLHSGERLTSWIRERLEVAADGGLFDLDVRVSGDAFLTPPGPLSALVSDACEAVLGHRPELSTSGGTSDARFIKNACPVVEFGLVGRTMHKTDEHVELADLAALADIYHRVLAAYPATAG